MSVPGYPVLGTHTLYAGGGVYPCLLKRENRFLPDLASIPRRVRKKAKLFYINYPNNPTGQVADREFYERILNFCPCKTTFLSSRTAPTGLLNTKRPP